MIEGSVNSQKLANIINAIDTLALGVPAYHRLHYEGLLAGSEFLTYAADKLYIALSVEFSQALGVPLVSNAGAILYDEANAANSYFIDNVAAYWDATAAAYKVCRTCSLVHHLLWFSRVTVTYWTNIIFNGYRITFTP
jgi:hypothetical protein